MLKKLKFLVGLAVLLVVMVYAIAFAQKNSGDVALDFMVGQAFTLPAGVWLGLGIALGAVLGVVTGVWAVAKMKLTNRSLRKQINELKQEIGE